VKTANIPARKRASKVTCLFLDIGGVLLTNGWDHHARKKAAVHFRLDYAAMEACHQMNFGVLEEGKLTLDEYLNRVVFRKKRPFTRVQFRHFIFAQSKPHPEMLELAARLKRQYGLKIAVVSNESRELNAHRIAAFGLASFVDFFVSSCYVHIRKPDMDIFRLALDIAQTPAERIVYVENTPLFVELAEGLGIRGILHTDYTSTVRKLASFGLRDTEKDRP
jgi:putative hydrolase of the HAD superfamily